MTEQDFLESDKQIRGQNYVCLSFISPENVLKNKEIFKFGFNQINCPLKNFEQALPASKGLC